MHREKRKEHSHNFDLIRIQKHIPLTSCLMQKQHYLHSGNLLSLFQSLPAFHGNHCPDSNATVFVLSQTICTLRCLTSCIQHLVVRPFVVVYAASLFIFSAVIHTVILLVYSTPHGHLSSVQFWTTINCSACNTLEHVMGWTDVCISTGFTPRSVGARSQALHMFSHSRYDWAVF